MKRKDKISLIAVIVAMFAIIFIASALTDDRIISQATCTAVIVITTAAALAFYIVVLCRYAADRKKSKSRHLDRYGATMSATLKHISGLPIAKNLPVEVLYCPDRILFRKGAQEITVSMEKITAIDLTTGQHTARQAMAGAATGKYVLGGKTGAAVGALAAVSTQLIISYTSGGESRSVVLDASSGGTFPAKVVKAFGQTHAPKSSKIEL